MHSNNIIVEVVEIDISEIEKTHKIAKLLANIRLYEGDVILLQGGLGAGKTEFSKTLIREISGDDSLVVPSPTFTIVQGYDFIEPPIFHFDFYRVNNLEEAHEVGIEEALAEGISIIEWPSKINGWYFRDPLLMEFTIDNSVIFGDQPKRTLKFSLSQSWKDRLYNLLLRV